jgi:glutathione S-transferase
LPWAHDLVVLVGLLSLLLYLYMGALVGRGRHKYGIAAPATTGHPDFERLYRVHYNTLEQLPIYLVSLFVFATYVHALVAAAVGAVWIIGRLLFMTGYARAANQRSLGFGISAVATMILFVGSIVGVIWDLVK